MTGVQTCALPILLFDAETGSPLAVLDSIEVTLRRTAAATALAATRLARPDSAVLAICGNGAQADPQLQALRDVLPIREVVRWDSDPARSDVASLKKATADADVIVTCTTARAPFLEPRHVRPGSFVAAVGADSPDKSEIAPALMARARVVCDSVEQGHSMGDLRHAVAAGAMTAADVAGDLASLVCGRIEGRQSPEQITLFDSTGMGLQDVAACAAVYLRAREAAVGVACPLGAA